jgi:hypothetical protein
MKFSNFVIFMLIVAGIFFLFALMVSESNEQYPDANINSSEWESQYDHVSEINRTVLPLQDKFEVIQDEDKGFFTKLAAGITAIPYAIIIFPQVIFGSLELAGDMSLGFLAALAIPAYIITIVLVIMLVWALFKLIEFFNKTPV